MMRCVGAMSLQTLGPVIVADVLASGARTLGEVRRAAEASLATLVARRHLVVARHDPAVPRCVVVTIDGPALSGWLVIDP